jgi:SAM-dependent MidA family methyltransferase
MSFGASNAPLIDRIKRQVETDGPIGIAEYMSICLGDAKAGYYTTGAPFGCDGDFITAPEISQMFGELIGIWCVTMWRKMGKPSRFNLIEMGPGRGTLMADLLRAAAIDTGFLKAAKVQLVEISRPLRDLQAKALSTYDAQVSWLDAVQDMEPLPTIFIGNEFLDALPFRQYVKLGQRWAERVVVVNNDRLAYSSGHSLLDPATLPENHNDQPDGAIYEMSSAREAIVEFIANQLKENIGAALLIDYGYIEDGFGDTFQAVASHKFVDTLLDPGKVDLTSHVDFSAYRKYFVNASKFELSTQAEFLLGFGLIERAGHLGQGKSKQEQKAIEQAVERLAGLDAMGGLFKVMVASNYNS